MASDLLSLADASQLLGVSAERVRQLVVAGDLPGVRFGNAWAVPRDAIAARSQASNRRGRPLGAKGAWAAIAGGDIDLSNGSRYRNRGEPHRFSMSQADVASLRSERHAMQSGVAASAYWGELLPENADEADLYLPSHLFEALDSTVAAVSDPLGSVVLRVVPDVLWSVASGGAASDGEGGQIAPRAAVALDLLESGDPRRWVAAENLVRSGE